MEKRTEVLNFIRQKNISIEEARNICLETKRILNDAIIAA